MNRKTWLALGAALLLGVAGITSGAAQSAGAALIDWWVMAGGGNPASAGTETSLTINDTLGQPVIGPSASADGQVVLGAGYWSGAAAGSVGPGGDHYVYLPMVGR